MQDDKWVEVELPLGFREQYEAYNHVPIGRALFLSKLEEAASICVHVEMDGESNKGDSFVEVARAFDRRMADIIGQWRAFLLEGVTTGRTLYSPSDDEVVNGMVNQVDAALRALKAIDVDLTPKRKQK